MGIQPTVVADLLQPDGGWGRLLNYAQRWGKAGQCTCGLVLLQLNDSRHPPCLPPHSLEDILSSSIWGLS